MVAIKNWKSIFDESIIDLIVDDWELQGGEQLFMSKELEGVGGHTTLIVSARVLCTNNTDGLYCNGKGQALKHFFVKNIIFAVMIMNKIKASVSGFVPAYLPK